MAVAGARPGVGRSRERGEASRVRVAEMQRARLLAGAVRAVEELGYAHVTVAHITARARVSRRTFYDLFTNREDCLLAVLEDVAARIEAELKVTGIDGLSWREQLRTGLWTILCFFDREPALARLCVVQSARGGERVLAYRDEVLASLADAIDEGRGESSRGAKCPSLTAEGLAGATLSILYARLLKGSREPLSALFDELMSMIVLPYLGPTVADRERTRSVPVLPLTVEGKTGPGKNARSASDPDPLGDVPMRLTYRTALVLEGLAEYPGVSNRAVADHVGISDQGQVSKLLARLERLGLLSNTGEGQAKGEPNAWWLTPKGVQVEHSIRARTRDHRDIP